MIMSETIGPLSQVLFAEGENRKEVLKQAVTLCSIACSQSQTLEKDLANEELETQAKWKLVWGPEQVDDYTVSVTYSEEKNTFALLVSSKTFEIHSSFISESYENLEIPRVSSWMFPEVAGAWVNQQLLTSVENSLQTDLVNFINTEVVSKKASLWVTGHGFAGAFAQVFALAALQKLEDKFHTIPIKVYPMTFASPSMFNFVFTKYFDSLFPFALRVHNSLDCVPALWGQVEKILDFYEEGSSCPEILALEIKECQANIRKLEPHLYHQSSGKGLIIPGKALGNFDFFDEANAQHALSNYAHALDAKSL